MKSLEELYLSCRDKSSKAHIREAINCYKGGAYRACIVSTWIALVYDFIEKINELALTKDREAIQLQKEIENNRIIPFVFFILSILFIVLGILRHENIDVLQKATRI